MSSGIDRYDELLSAVATPIVEEAVLDLHRYLRTMFPIPAGKIVTSIAWPCARSWPPRSRFCSHRACYALDRRYRAGLRFACRTLRSAADAIEARLWY